MSQLQLTDWQWIIAVISALLLFLYGLEHFSAELQRLGQDHLRRGLNTITTHRLGGFALGAVATAIIQSSSAVTSLVVALVNSGTLTFAGSLAVLLGANVGTTATAWLVSFKLTSMGPVLIVLGGLLTRLPWRIRMMGRAIFYFGFIFFSLDLVSQSIRPIQNEPWLIEWLAMASTPWMGVLVGAAVTVLLQSSSVVTGLAIVLVQQGALPPEAAIAMVVGANAGSTTTALVASIPMGTIARQTAWLNAAFNFSGVVLMLPWLGYYAAMVLAWQPDAGQAVAWAHLGFNVGIAVLFLPLTGWIAQRFSIASLRL
jgi:Na/Pi-cotransporter